MSKVRRQNYKLDMTPMVDVAFLLLTFFILTTQFRPPQVAEIILPESNSAFKVPDKDVMTITVDTYGKIYLGVDSENLRAILFGVENRLKSGIEVSTEQLATLLQNARIKNPKLRTMIRADKNSEYGIIERVMDVLQKTKITRFNLVTDLEKGE